MQQITIVSKVVRQDTFGYAQDVLSGLNVRAYNYLVEEVVVDHVRYDEVIVPFAVLLWDDGLDYDSEGNAYFDDYPGDFLHSSHQTRRGAEIEAAWLEHHGVGPRRISICADYTVYRYQLRYHPLGV